MCLGVAHDTFLCARRERSHFREEGHDVERVAELMRVGRRQL